MPRNIKELLTLVSSKLLRQTTPSEVQLKKKVQNKKINMKGDYITTHLVYGVILMDGYGPIEDKNLYEVALEDKKLESNGLILIEFGITSMWILGIKDSHEESDSSYNAIWFYQNEIKPEWTQILIKYCKKYKIKSDMQPEWGIVTYIDRDYLT